MPKSRKGGRRKGRKHKSITKLVPKTLRSAISKVHKAARSAARGVDEYALIKAPKMVLGPILKSRFGGRRSMGGSKSSRGGRKSLRGGSKSRRGGRKSRRGGYRLKGGGKMRGLGFESLDNKKDAMPGQPQSQSKPQPTTK